MSQSQLPVRRIDVLIIYLGEHITRFGNVVSPKSNYETNKSKMLTPKLDE